MIFDKMKKLTAALLSATMCISGGVTAFAADDGWKITFNGTERPKGDTYYADYTMAAAYDGNYSLEVVYPGNATTYPNSSLELSATVPGTLEAGTYDFKFYIFKQPQKGVTKKSQVSVAGVEFIFDDCTQTNIGAESAPSGEEGWIEYSKQITMAETQNAEIKFTFKGPVAGCYLDEVTLTKDGGDNLITCGGFESVVPENEDYDPAPYTPTDVIVSPSSSGALALSWKNPTATTMTSLELYDVTSGEAVLLNNGFTTTAEARNLYVTDALSEGNSYLYKLVFNWSDISATEYFIGGTAQSASAEHTLRTIGDVPVSVKHSNAKYPYALFDAKIDTAEKNAGDASLHIICNQDTYKDNVSIGMSFPIEVEAGADYRLTFNMKSDVNPVGLYVRMYGDSTQTFDDDYVMGNDAHRLPATVGPFDWKQITAVRTNMDGGVTKLNITMTGNTDGIWIDDLDMRKITKDGEGNTVTVGDNLISIGDFEGLISSEVGTLNNVKATAGEGSAKISWTAASNVDSVNLYQLIGEESGDKWAYRGNIDSGFCDEDGVTTVALTELRYGADYTFKAVPVNADGFEGTAQTINVTTKAPDYLVGTPEIYNGKIKVDSVSGGSFNVKTSVKNNIYQDGMPYEMIVAIFKDGALYELKSSGAKSIPCSPANSNATQVSTSIDVPSDGGNYSVGVYHINSKTEWGVIAPHTIFN